MANPLQYSCLENSMDRGAWQAIAHGVAKSQIQLSNNKDWAYKICICANIAVSMGFPSSSASKEFACNAGDPSSILGSERSPGEGNGYPLQYSGLENSMEIGAWQAIVHEVAKSWT